MQRSLFHCFLFLVSCSLGLPLSGLAQTITVGTLSPAAVCAGKATVISVPFTTTGSFGSTNTFTAQLSDATGTFSSSTTNIGTLTTASSTTAATTRTISATILSGVAAGTGYQVRVISLATPVKTSSNNAGLTVTSLPSAPGVTTLPVAYCLGETAVPLSASPVSGATLNWYTVSSGGTPSSVAPTPDTRKADTLQYYVSQSLNSCESTTRAPLTVTVNGTPPAPSAPSSLSFCRGVSLSALTATAASGATLRWYGTNANGGTFSLTAPVPDNQNSATYYVSQARGNCESSRTAITVTIASPLAPSVVSPAASYCPGQTAAPLSATAATGGTLNWYGPTSTGGTSSATATVPSTTSSGTTVYYVSQTVGSCESPRAAISVTVKPTPATPSITNLALCQNRSASALTASDVTGTINWYSPASSTPSTTAPTPSVTATGATSYSVSQTINGCESGRATLTVTVNAVPAIPTVATAGPTYCQGVSAQPLSATGTALLWYGTNQTGGSGNSTATVPATSSTGPTTYYVTQTTNGCVSDRAGITVTVKTTPARPDVVNVTFCQNTNAPGLTATASSGATLNWYGTSQTGGTRTDSPPVIPNTTATTYTYYVSQTLDGCESASRSPITAQVKQTPGAPTVTPVEYCNNERSQQLNAGGNNIKWYDAAGSSLSSAPTPPTNNVGQQTYQATQTLDGCESQQKATLIVTIKPLPGQPGVTNLSYCQPTQDQPAQNVGPLTASGDNLRWYNTDGNPFQSAPTPPVAQVGTYNYQVSQTVNGCEGSRATLQVAVTSTPAPTVTTPLVTYCINTTAAPLQASAATGASLRWIDPYNRTTENAPTPSTLNSNVVAGGDPFYVYQIGSNGCYSSRSTIRVIVNVAPTLALTGASEVNLGTLAPVKLSFTGAPPFSYTLTDGYSGISRTNDTTIYVLPRGNTTYQIVSVANSCGIGLPGNPATATITVRVPVITTSVLQTTTVCAGSSFAVPFTTTGPFTAGNLFTAELVSVADTSRKIGVSPNGTTGSIVTAAVPLTLTAGQYYVRVKGSNPSVGITGSNSPSVLTVRARATATLTGTQSIYEGSPATLTLTFGGEAPWTATYADSLRSYTVTAASSPYALEVQPARATTYRLTGVSNNCGVGTAVSGSAVVTVQKVLGVEDPSLGPLVTIYPVPAGATLTVDIDVSLLRDPATLTLHDAGGRPVLNQTTRTRQTILDVNSQPAGTYLLRIQVGDRQLVRRILKQ